MARIFMSQAFLDAWIPRGAIQLDGDMLRLAALPQLGFFVNPAVCFEAVDGGGTDPYDVIGVVKTSQELAQMNADHYERSVVLGEHAYTVQPGFVAVAIGPDGRELPLDPGTWGYIVGALEQLMHPPA